MRECFLNNFFLLSGSTTPSSRHPFFTFLELQFFFSPTTLVLHNSSHSSNTFSFSPFDTETSHIFAQRTSLSTYGRALISNEQKKRKNCFIASPKKNSTFSQGSKIFPSHLSSEEGGYMDLTYDCMRWCASLTLAFLVVCEYVCRVYFSYL